nr:MAG TPA: hypothetical protein [Caudoviricetes sp.]
MVDKDKYAFDFPRIEENRELYSSPIDWEREEKEREEQEKENKRTEK